MLWRKGQLGQRATTSALFLALTRGGGAVQQCCGEVGELAWAACVDGSSLSLARLGQNCNCTSQSSMCDSHAMATLWAPYLGFLLEVVLGQALTTGPGLSERLSPRDKDLAPAP